MTSYELQSRGASAILEKIMELQQEIALINLHERTHVVAGTVNFEAGCEYCQLHSGRTLSEQVEGNKKAAFTIELERSVELVGKAGAVAVPRSWVGKRVKVQVLD